MPIEVALTDLSKAPAYQEIAEQADHLHRLGMTPTVSPFALASIGRP